MNDTEAYDASSRYAPRAFCRAGSHVRRTKSGWPTVGVACGQV